MNFMSDYRHGMVRVATAAPRGRVADINGNVKRHIAIMREAQKQGVEILVFPELSLPKYSAQDLHHSMPVIEGSIDVLVALNRMIRYDILNVLGVVANMAPAQQRARLAKGTLKALGQGHIPVGRGTACPQPDDDGLEYQFNVGYLARNKHILNGKALILRTLRQAKPKSLVFLLISGLTDAAEVLRDHRELFISKVRRVGIMSGIIASDDMPTLDDCGRMQPDNANNHTFDMESAKYLYRELQDARIPMTVLTRHAATAAKVSRAVYDEMAATGHLIGIRLRDMQKNSIEHLWRRACLPRRWRCREVSRSAPPHLRVSCAT